MTFYNWKAKYRGMAVSDLKRMKELDDGLSPFKRMYADLALENQAMKNLIEKKALRPSEKFEATGFMFEEHGLSVPAVVAVLTSHGERFIGSLTTGSSKIVLWLKR